MRAPIAPKRPKVLSKHGDSRIDDYYWLNDRSDDEVIAYLNAENAYTKEKLAHTEDLQSTLYDEMVGRIKQTDMSVPYDMRGHQYYRRYEEGKEYPIHARKKQNDPEEQILLDVNQHAAPFDFYQAIGLAVSPDNTKLAWGEDTVSRRIYTLRFKDIAAGEILPDKIENTTGHAVWAADNKTLFYTRRDDALRPFKIFRHTLGTDPSDDDEIYHEKDDTFRTVVYKTKSQAYIVITSQATLSSEYRIIPADQPDATFKIFAEREPKHEYSIAHAEGKFYMISNWQATNFRLLSCPENQTSKEHWNEVIPHDPGVLLEGLDVFANYLVISERAAGLTRLRVLDQQHKEQIIAFDEAVHAVETNVNADFSSKVLRIKYTSLATPDTILDYDMVTGERTTLKQQEVVGDFNPDDYVSERLMIPSHDGVEVPVSLVYRKGYEKNGKAPLLLYGYGSYGYSIDPYFSIARLSLLDRGFAFAIAHIRGGEEMGRQWYEDGKFLKKKNTFLDFIACGQYLINQKYSDPARLFGMGGSAGGLLIGAAINIAPDLFCGVIAAVPFVDVLTTMLDDSIPLTTGEYSEWGNPNDPDYYHYMKSYSPYDNVQEVDYPHILVTTGLHDSQVQYWEPAKWVAKLRTHKTTHRLLLLKTDMETGHGGASGRFKRYRETATEYAFLLDLARNLA